MYIFDAYNHDGIKQLWRRRNKDACKCRIHTPTVISVVTISLFMSAINYYYSNLIKNSIGFKNDLYPHS